MGWNSHPWRDLRWGLQGVNGGGPGPRSTTLGDYFCSSGKGTILLTSDLPILKGFEVL